MRSLTGIAGVTTTLEADERVLEVVVDRDKAARFLLTEAQVSGIVAAQLRPSALGKVNIEGNELEIFVNQDAVDSIDKVKALAIPTFQGAVKLDQIASVTEVLKPTSITSERGNRTARVSVAPSGDDLGAISEAVQTKLEAVNLPSGVTTSVGGAATDQAESFEQLGLAMLAAIAIVYIVMVATFGSLIQPLILLISIPFAAIGSLGLLLLTDTPLGVPALIGMLMLIGIVVTNAIVLIDLVNQYRKKGKSVQESLLTGARQRLRPILMTALATIFALTPMAFGLTGNSGFISKPLAIVVIGGLFTSTILTLILVPVLYWLVEGRKERKVIRLERRANKAMLKQQKKDAKAQAKADKLAAKAAPETTPAPAAAAPVVVATPVIPAEPEPVLTTPEVPAVAEPTQAEPIAAQVVEQVVEAVAEQTPASNWEEQIAATLAEEAGIQQAAADEPEQFTPVTPAEAPALAWSLEDENVPLDNESQMTWDESSVPSQPMPAVKDEPLPEFLTEESKVLSKQEIKEAKRRAKEELKAQKRAAKNSRHSND
jgi:hydrophobic/amphiphilic exporter-1 (mainly G- bacteria), HAE1 family